MDEFQRNLWCSFYPFCLDVHVRCSKRKFTCIGCKRYRPIHLEAEEAIEDGVRCGEFLNALFFGLHEEEEMPKKLQPHDSPSEFVSVPVNLLRSLLYSLNSGIEFLQSSYNLAQRLNEVLKQREKHGQFFIKPEGDTGGTDPGAEGGDLGIQN